MMILISNVSDERKWGYSYHMTEDLNIISLQKQVYIVSKGLKNLNTRF